MTIINTIFTAIATIATAGAQAIAPTAPTAPTAPIAAKTKTKATPIVVSRPVATAARPEVRVGLDKAGRRIAYRRETPTAPWKRITLKAAEVAGATI